ncbi:MULTISPECIES: helix-turn-helix domain-containing protein [unclassified Sphingobacterium]|uniref:helix-turn-helix domain-containing protein n=1 Tax=unclassified Sphingobacterium TaxID=2609468 RepID=UPI0020C2F5E5|nr:MULTISPECIES: helix-turn-helix domain-containing protein [unclassified Sphingobacterium]
MEEVVFVQIKLSDLQDMIKKAVDDGIKDSFEKFVESEPKLIDSDEMCARFGITRQTIKQWRERNEIPYVQIGGIYRYDYNKIIKIKETKRKR